MRMSYAQVRGFGPWQYVWLGPGFDSIPADEQDAVFQHEIGHVVLRHQQKRIGWLLACKWVNPKQLQQDVWAQEFEADRFSARQGHGPALIRFLTRRAKSAQDFWHPPVAERIEKLRRLHGHRAKYPIVR